MKSLKCEKKMWKFENYLWRIMKKKLKCENVKSIESKMEKVKMRNK